MTLPNHLIGGVAITGTIAAFFDINVLSSWQLLTVCGFASTLPDIDAPRSLVGRLLKPISKYINTHYGHRTITHSLVALFSVWLIAGFVEVSAGFEGFCVVFTAAYFSHILLDMVTLQGVAFLYPWLKNPCVLPGRPESRIRTGDVRSETIFAGVFIFAIFTLQPLFERGFWNTYNRSFGTLKHLHSEFRKTDGALFTTYEIQRGSEILKGEGTVVFSSEDEAVLFNQGQFIQLQSEPFPVSVQPTRTDTPIVFTDTVFINLSLEQLQAILDSSEVMRLQFQATEKVTISANQLTQVTDNFSGEYVSDVSIFQRRQELTEKPVFRANPRVGKLRAKIKRIRANYNEAKTERQSAERQAAELRKKAVAEKDLQRRQELTERADAAEKAVADVSDVAADIAELEEEIRVLEADASADYTDKLREWKTENTSATLLFTGYAELVRIGSN